MWGRTADRRIETPRLTLRPPRMDDASALAGTIGNYDVVRWLGSVPFPYGVEDAERFIAGLDRSKERHWLIFEDDALVGGIGISGELGFWLARTAWGRGIATEAADAVIDLHFRDRKAEALVSGHFVSNERSARVLDKLGFRDDGVTTIDARVLGQRVESRRVVLTRQDWLARRHYFLRARGLVLRNLRPSDWRGVRRLLATEGAAPSKAEARHWIAGRAYRGRPDFSAALCSRLGRFIGTVGLHRAQGGTLALVVQLPPGKLGRARITGAVGAFLEDMQRRFGVTEVVARDPSGEPASAAMLGKLGFVEMAGGQGDAAGGVETVQNVNYRLTMGGEGAAR